MDRLRETLECDWTHEMKWHKTCYVKFTAESRLERLRNKPDPRDIEDNNGAESIDEQDGRVSRSSNSTVNWNLCIFCQLVNIIGIRNVSTMGLSEKIINLAKNDLVMRVRLAGISDLIAAEGKYHLKCLVQFEQKHKRSMKNGK